MRKWFGFSQEGTVVSLGEHEDFDGADNTEEGQLCSWIWSEEALREFINQAQEALKI